MAKTQQERDKVTEERRQLAGEVELRHRVRLGSRQLVDELMEWHGFTQIAEVIQMLILNFHALGDSALPKVAARSLQGAEPLRHRARPGVLEKLEDIAAWLDLKDHGQVVEHLITRAHDLGPIDSAPLLAVPRHEFHVSETWRAP